MNCAADECGYDVPPPFMVRIADIDATDWEELFKRQPPTLLFYKTEQWPVSWPPYIPLWSKPESVYTQTQEAKTNECITSVSEG